MGRKPGQKARYAKPDALPDDPLLVNGRPTRRSRREYNRMTTREAQKTFAEREAEQQRTGTRALVPAPSESLLKQITQSAHFVPYDPALPSTAGDYPRKGLSGRPPAESSQAAYAFALYCSLPPGERSYQGVMDILVTEGRNSPTSLPMISRWGARWNWVERAKIHDAQIIEESRKRWEIERISMHQEIAATSAAVYGEVVKLLEQRARDGKLGNDAAVQLMRIAADLRHRSYQELTAVEEKKQAKGIEITIETRTDSGEAKARFAQKNPQVIALAIPLRDPDDADYAHQMQTDTMVDVRAAKADPRKKLMKPRIMEGSVVESSEHVEQAEEGEDGEEGEDDTDD